LKFHELLLDILSVIDPFKSVISHVALKKLGDGTVRIVAKSCDKSVSIQAFTKEVVEDFEHTACLGNLPYLHSVMKSKYISKSSNVDIDLDYELASNGTTTALKTITVSDGNKLVVHYRAVDPFIAKFGKPKSIEIDSWAVVFGIDKTVIDDYAELNKIHRASPKIGSEQDDLFRLTYDDGKVFAIFGEKGNSAKMVLSSVVESNGGNKLSALFSATRFQSMLGLVKKSGQGIAYVASKALRVETETETVSYTFETAAKMIVE